jgi:2-polyprenyl-6-methoxyphenol hydroxylase-like FAD-dependent oxidoreductase
MAIHTQKRAVVVGASMAGLLAARVLADHFGQVTLIERDSLSDEIAPRRGVPQGAHAHALLAGGASVLEQLFPGFADELIARGAVRGYGRFFSGGGYHDPYRFGGGGLFASRPLIEDAVRSRVLALANVRLIDNRAVRGFQVDEAGTRVTGVRGVPAQQAHEPAAHELATEAGLVVDASGRGTRTPAWLEALGYPQPELEVVEVDMAYSSRFYRREPQHLNGDAFANITATPSNRRASGMLAQEGQRWIVTLAGYFGDFPPTDDQGFLAFARSLPASDVYDTIRDATPLSQPVTFRFPSNQRRHYERLARFPEGLLVLGDALCSFTPLYGQGMSVAAQEAAALGACLSEGDDRLAQRFFARASAIVDMAWTITAGSDRRLAGERPRRPSERLLGWYMDRLQVAARYDPQVALAFLRVSNLLAAPASVLQPHTAWRVLLGNIRHASLQRAR